MTGFLASHAELRHGQLCLNYDDGRTAIEHENVLRPAHGVHFKSSSSGDVSAKFASVSRESGRDPYGSRSAAAASGGGGAAEEATVSTPVEAAAVGEERFPEPRELVPVTVRVRHKWSEAV
eukprot:1005673-Rhodomonas_salina.1